MSRFEDTLQRDLTVIADRATPSPHAWQQIQRRIIDQEPPQETEIIMLTDNTARPRRWPVLAAAAAVLALVIGGVALVNRDDGSNDPADDPTPPTITVPKPDGETAAPTRTVDLAGTFIASYDIAAPDADGVSALTGSETYRIGDSVLRGEVTGSGVFGDGASGTVATVYSGEIAGIGSGTIDAEATFEQSGGVTTGIGTITGGTGDFEGASGSTLSRNTTGSSGTFEWTLTLPADRFAEDFTESTESAEPAGDPAAVRTVTLSGVTERTLEPVGPNPPEEGTWSAVGSMSADGVRFDTTSSGTYVALADEVIDGTMVAVLDGTIDGIGSGSITIEGEFKRRVYDENGSYTITDASGAFEGATGTVEMFSDVRTDGGTWTMELTLPADRFADDFVEPVASADPASTPTELLPGLPATPGTYTTDALGTELTFEVGAAADGPWQTAVSPGTVWLYTGAGEEFVQMTRIGGWYDATEAADPDVVGFGSIGAADIDRLIAERADLEITDGGNVTAGGRAARSIEFGLDPTSSAGEGICDPGQRPCTWFVSRSEDAPGPDGGRANSLLGDRLVRAWVIDMDGYEPILIEGSTSRDDKVAWLDEVLDPIVGSLTIGAPTYTVPGGTASLTTDVVATGTWTDDGYSEVPLEDGSFDVNYVTTLDGDLRGTSTPIEAFRIPVPEASGGSIGGGRFEFVGEIDGIGSGTLMFREEYISLPVFLSVGAIVGGTDDFAGATGWALFNPDSVAGTYEFHISVPRIAPPEVETRVTEIEAAFTVTDVAESDGPDGTTRLGATTEFSGGFDGVAPTSAVVSGESGGTTRGAGTRVLTGDVEGLGTGSLVLEGPFRFDADGNYVGLAGILGGTGDFAGAGGSIRFESGDAGATGTATIELALPVG